jgi:hypothetical protein
MLVYLWTAYGVHVVLALIYTGVPISTAYGVHVVLALMYTGVPISTAYGVHVVLFLFVVLINKVTVLDM